MRCGALAWKLTEAHVEMDVCADVMLKSIRVSGFGVRGLKAGRRFGMEVD